MLATAARAQSDRPADENATKATAPAGNQAARRARDERVNCRQVEESAGSRLTTRVCLTARQWRERNGY